MPHSNNRWVDLASSARETYEQNRERMQRGVESIRSTAERAMDQVRSTAGNVASKAGDSTSGSNYKSPSSQAV